MLLFETSVYPGIYYKKAYELRYNIGTQ